MHGSLIQLYKQAYTGLSRNSWYLSAVMLVNRSGTMVVPFMSIYCVQQLHFTITQAGTIIACYGLGALSGAFTGGKLTDRFGFYDLQVGALMSGGILFILLGYQHTFLSMTAGIFILSFCNESFRPANSTAIAHYSGPENTTRSFSLNRLAVNLGWAVGGALGGLLASINYHLLFWVDGCTNILAAVLLLKLMPRSKTVRSIRATTQTVAASPAYRDKVYVVFILLSVLFGICFFQFFIMEPVFYKLAWHFNERFIGFLLALNGLLIVIIEMVLIHNLEKKRGPLIYISVGIVLTGIGFILLNLLPASAISAIIVVVLITFGEMLSMPFMNSFWIARTMPHNRGEYAALYSMSWSAAQILAPFLGSEVILYGGFATLWWVLGAITVVTSSGYLMMHRAGNKKTTAIPQTQNV